MTTNPGTDNPPVDRPLTAAAATRYQQLRGHLAALRLHTAAEQLPAVLDQASNEGLSVTAALERLLRTSTLTPPPAWTGSWSPSSAPAATSSPPPT